MVPQIQHFGLYPYAGRENFANYITANSCAAVFPAIAAALGATVLSVVLVFHQQEFFSRREANRRTCSAGCDNCMGRRWACLALVQCFGGCSCAPRFCPWQDSLIDAHIPAQPAGVGWCEERGPIRKPEVNHLDEIVGNP